MHLDLASFRCAHASTEAPCLSALLAHLRYRALSLFWRGGQRTEWVYSSEELAELQQLQVTASG